MSALPSALQRIATRWAGMLTTIAKGYAPRHIAPYIHSSTSERGKEGYTIVLSVNLDENPEQRFGSSDARAQEYGSGIKTTKYGKMDYIPIFPKRGKFLAFNWEVANQSPEAFRFLPDGRVILRSVQSPGIPPYKGEGYLKPAVRDLRAKARADMDPDIRSAITGDLRVAFKHAK